MNFNIPFPEAVMTPVFQRLFKVCDSVVFIKVGQPPPPFGPRTFFTLWKPLSPLAVTRTSPHPPHPRQLLVGCLSPGICPSRHFAQVESHATWSFETGFFHELRVSKVHRRCRARAPRLRSFSRPRRTPLCGQSTSGVSAHPWLDVWATAISRLLE